MCVSLIFSYRIALGKHGEDDVDAADAGDTGLVHHQIIGGYYVLPVRHFDFIRHIRSIAMR